MATLKFDVFGRHIFIARSDGSWLASDIIIPASVSEDDLPQYLADLCHEWATASHSDVRQL
jgi:hypothetical protein